METTSLREQIIREPERDRQFRREMAMDVLENHPDSELAEYHKATLAILDELQNEGRVPTQAERKDLAANRRSGGQRGGNQYGSYTVRYASEKQARFLQNLFETRDYSGKGDKARAELNRAAAELGTGKIALRLASDAIDSLLTCPVAAGSNGLVRKVSDKQVALIAREVARRVGGEEALAAALKERNARKVEEIHFGHGSALIDALFELPLAPRPKMAELEDGVYLYHDVVYKVQHAAGGSGRQYAKKLVVDAYGQAHFEYAKGIIFKLGPEHKMTKEQAQKFGALYGTCCRCGRTLSNEDSIERMMGPVCYAKMGW